MIKRTILFTLAIFSLSFPQDIFKEIGPFGGRVLTVVSSQNNDKILTIAGNSPYFIYTSGDQGQSWQESSTINSYIRVIAVNPFDRNNIFLGLYGKVEITEDFCATWTTVEEGIDKQTNIMEVEVSKNNPDIVYAAGTKSENGELALVLNKSVDKGNTWTNSIIYTSKTFTLYDLATDPSNANIVYISGLNTDSIRTPFLLKSVDGGTAFTDIMADDTTEIYLTTMLVSNNNSNVLFGGSTVGIYRSVNGGDSWNEQVLNTGYMGEFSNWINEDTVFCSGKNYIYRSIDAGKTWTTLENGLYGALFNPVIWTNNNTETILTSNLAGIFKSEDLGDTWENCNGTIAHTDVLTLAFNPVKQSELFASVRYCGIQKSENFGDTWQKVETPLDCGNISSFAMHKDMPNTILAVEGNG